MVGKYPHTATIREVRRTRAEAVQAKSAGLTPQERLAKLDAAGLTATKERAKIARKAAKSLMTATPAEFGEAAVRGAKKAKAAK